MTGTDPAVAAAIRAMDVRADNRIAQGAAAAREALDPIRELHVRQGDHCGTCFADGAIAALWPCPTARLIYTSEELGVTDPAIEAATRVFANTKHSPSHGVGYWELINAAREALAPIRARHPPHPRVRGPLVVRTRRPRLALPRRPGLLLDRRTGEPR